MIQLSAYIEVSNNESLIINNRNLINFNCNVIDRDSIELPSWGIISNGGKITILDYNSTYKKLAQDNKLVEGLKITVYLNNTMLGIMSQVGEFYTTNWDYDNSGFNVTVSFNDGLEKLQSTSFTPYKYDLSQNDYKLLSGAKLYDYLAQEANTKGFKMLSSSKLDEITNQHLNKFLVKPANIIADNLWRAIDEFSVALQLHTFKQKNGEIVSVYRGGD